MNTVKKLLATAAMSLCAASPTFAQSTTPPVKIGMLMDMSGNYSEVAGKGSVTAAQMAVEDFGGTVLGRKVEVVSADMQNKVDLATSIAREWFDKDGVDAVMDVNNSSAALAVSEIAKQKNKIVSISISGSPRLTNEACNPNTIHYVYDTYALARSNANAVLKAGGKKWYFITVDYTFGTDFQRDTTKAVEAGGGTVVGSSKVPLNASDYSSAITQAMASKADVVAFATAGSDTANGIKQASEYGVGTNGQKIVGLLVYINEVNALGLDKAQGMLLTSSFYWDMNDQTRAFSKRYFARMKLMPNMSQAGVYSSVMHYLQAIKAAGTTDTAAVMAKMKSMPVNDFFTKNGHIRADGLMVHDLYLFRVKTPKESKGPWDYYQLVQTIPADQAFMPESQSVCPLVKK